MSETNKLLVQRYFEEIFNRHNYAVCTEILATDYTENAAAPFQPTAPGAVNGPAHIQESAAWLIAQFPDMHMTVETLIAEDNIVACRVHSEGTNLGKFNGALPPTGKHFAARQSHWFRVQDNQLAEHWATRDDLSTLIQLGIIPVPAQPRSAPFG